MHFSEIVENLISDISSDSKFTSEQIRKHLMRSRESKKSDFCLFLNQISNNPIEDAKELYEQVKSKNIPLIKDLTLKDTSISFNINKEKIFKDVLLTINSMNDKYGSNSIGKGKTYLVDFSSPNIAKIFHVGHFRTTVLGHFVINLLKVCGFKTIAFNYLGDWGKQFGFVLLGFKKYGNEELLKTDSLNHLFDIYVKINKDASEDPSVHDEARRIFNEMQNNEQSEYLVQWKRFREMSIEKYKELYAKLGIEFDVYSGESFYNKSALEFAENNKLSVTDEDGSKYIDCGTYGHALIQKVDGSTVYMTRDIVSIMDRVDNYKADKLIYVVASQQDLHLQQLFTIGEKLGYPKDLFEHISYGMVKGMSTRNGSVHFLEDILEQMTEAIKTRLLSNPEKSIEIKDKEKTALNLAITTLVIADLSAKRIKGYTFNFDQRANCESGSGAYLQYAHCRLLSIKEKNNHIDLSDLSDVDFESINSEEVLDLVYKLLWYEYAVEVCLEDYEPSRIVTYLMDLAKNVNNLIPKLMVKNVPANIAKARLLLLDCTRIVIHNALKLLGLEPLNKM